MVIEETMEGARIDSALSLALPEASRNLVQKLIETGMVTVNGSPCLHKNYRVTEGEVAEILIQPPVQLEIRAEPIPLTILYEDRDLLVVDKPKGMVVHPGPGNPSHTLVNALMYHCGDRLSSINGVIRPGIVHRIDKDTSGLLVVAKTDTAHRSLAGQLAEHTIARAYRAVVYHNMARDEGTVNMPIGRDPKNRLRQAVGGVSPREAVTHYRVLERFGKFTYLEARLETGRTHQIRVHMAYLNHPILGDPLYGPKKKILGAESQMLHAGTLGFIHPVTGAYMEFESGLPESFSRVLTRLRQGV